MIFIISFVQYFFVYVIFNEIMVIYGNAYNIGSGELPIMRKIVVKTLIAIFLRKLLGYAGAILEFEQPPEHAHKLNVVLIAIV
jgi:hypothetical protein